MNLKFVALWLLISGVASAGFQYLCDIQSDGVCVCDPDQGKCEPYTVVKLPDGGRQYPDAGH